MKSKKEKLLKHAASKEGAAKAMNLNRLKMPAKSFVFFVGFLLLANLIFCNAALAQKQEPKSPGKVLVIPVHKTIDNGVSFFIQRMLRKAEQEQASVIVLEINSNGGLVSSAQEIKDALLRTKTTTVAYIKGRALSAAALVAISCHRIFMEPGSEMGAATPFKMMGSAVKAAEEKFVSAFRGEFESAAEARKRPKALAGAMVDKNHDTIPGLVKKGEILTLTSETALSHGYCDYVVPDIKAALRRLNLESATLERVEPTSAEWLARYLTNPNISVILFSVGFWCLLIEFFIAGFGIFGYLGITCLVLFFGGHLFAYLAGLEALILFSIGIILLLLEIFVIPGFGIAGISGILAVCFSVVMVFGGVYSAVFALAKIICIITGLSIAMYTWGPKLKLFDKFVLKADMTTEKGFVAVDNNAFNHLLKLEGIAVSPCRPSGKVKIGDERYDVVSDGDFIEKGSRVIVRKVEGTKIVVRELSE